LKISLKKVSKIPFEFEIALENVVFKGFLQYHNDKLFLLEAKLSGTLDTQCSRCGDDLALVLDEDVKFFVCDGVYHTQNEIEDIDVVEVFASTADMDELLVSETELIKSDYHLCGRCQGGDAI
jgi:uncharacterized metal-binding protein YceD (DUF177 family)